MDRINYHLTMKTRRGQAHLNVQDDPWVDAMELQEVALPQVPHFVHTVGWTSDDSLQTQESFTQEELANVIDLTGDDEETQEL